MLSQVDAPVKLEHDDDGGKLLGEIGYKTRVFYLKKDTWYSTVLFYSVIMFYVEVFIPTGLAKKFL